MKTLLLLLALIFITNCSTTKGYDKFVKSDEYKSHLKNGGYEIDISEWNEIINKKG